jgi:hypothetical protein
MSEPNEQAQAKTVYGDGPAFFDRKNGKLQLGFADNRIMLTFVPIFTEMVGKEPRRGDRVYDYQNKIAFFVDVERIPVLKRQVEALEAGQIDEGFLDIESRTLGVHGPGIFENPDGTPVECPSVSVALRDGSRQIIYAFQPVDVVIGKKNEEGGVLDVVETMSPEWELFKDFVSRAAFDNACGANEQGAKRAMGSSRGPATMVGTASATSTVRRREGRIGNGTVPSVGGSTRPAAPASAENPGEFFDNQVGAGSPDDALGEI